MKDTIVQFETAKLLKEKEFTDIIGVYKGKHYYNYLGELDGDTLEELKHRKDSINLYKSIAAPTQSLVQKWLREVHNIDVLVYKVGKKYTTEYCTKHYNTYEQALEEALQEALKLIK